MELIHTRYRVTDPERSVGRDAVRGPLASRNSSAIW